MGSVRGSRDVSLPDGLVAAPGGADGDSGVCLDQPGLAARRHRDHHRVAVGGADSDIAGRRGAARRGDAAVTQQFRGGRGGLGKHRRVSSDDPLSTNITS